MNEWQPLTEIIANEPLALDFQTSVEAGVALHHVHIAGSTASKVVQNALDAAIRDIDDHPKGKLFQRFIEHGPHGAVDLAESDTTPVRELKDAEIGTCIEFIHSHMVSRFIGELAELLAIEPCVRLIRRLQDQHKLPRETDLFLGDTIRERRRVGGEWKNFTKGADGLVVRVVHQDDKPALELHGVIEVKSMYVSKSKLDAQIKRCDGVFESIRFRPHTQETLSLRKWIFDEPPSYCPSLS